MALKSVLGKSIGAILEDVEQAYNNDLVDENNIQNLNLSYIELNPYQPRQHFDEEAIKELSESIKTHGLIQPVIVIKDGLDRYTLIAGERRLRATKLLGSKTIKAIISDLNFAKIRELAIIENIQREDLNPIELATSYEALMKEYKITQEELSKTLKKSRTQITNTLRLLKLSTNTKQNLVEGKLSQGHAKVIIGLQESEEAKIVNSIIGQKLSVRETELLVKKMKDKDTPIKDIKKVEINKNLEKLVLLFERHNIKSKISGNDLKLILNNQTILKLTSLLQ